MCCVAVCRTKQQRNIWVGTDLAVVQSVSKMANQEFSRLALLSDFSGVCVSGLTAFLILKISKKIKHAICHVE